MTTVRYGVELEGRHKGRRTLVLLSGRHHDLGAVRRLLCRHKKAASHLWLELRRGERYDWRKVLRLSNAGFKVTALLRGPQDLPPLWVAGQVDFIWRVPDRYRALARCCGHLNVLRAAFVGYEARLTWRALPTARYWKDETWRA